MSGTATTPLSRADTLIIERAERDFEEGLAFVRDRLRDPSRHSMLVGKAMEVGVMGIVSTLQLRPRYRHDVQFLLALAHRVNAGEDATQLARDNLDRAIRMREVALVARTKEPEFQRVLDIARTVFEARLPDLARMVAVPDPVDYPDLVRRSFDSSKHVAGFLLDNRDRMLEMTAHFEAHPKLLRIPHGWVPSLAHMTREVIEWETARVVRSVEEIFSASR